MSKHPTILALIEELRPLERGWEFVDNWNDDLYAVGFADSEDSARLVYVSSWQQEPGRYSYECEEPMDEEPGFRVGAKAKSVGLEELIEALEGHLGSKDSS